MTGDVTPIVFVDVETLSLLRPLYGGPTAVWEAAVIRADLQRVERTLTIVDNWWGYLHVHPDMMEDADPGSLRVNRFYERHPAYRRPSSSVDLSEWQEGAVAYPGPGSTPIDTLDDVPADEIVWSHEAAAGHIARLCAGAMLIAANPTFDEERLAELLHLNGHMLAVDYHLGCVRNLAAGWLAGRAAAAGHPPTVTSLPPWSGRKLTEALNVPLSDEHAHRAWDDAMACVDTFARVFDLPVLRPGETRVTPPALPPDENPPPAPQALTSATGGTVTMSGGTFAGAGAGNLGINVAADQPAPAPATADRDLTLADLHENPLKVIANEMFFLAGVEFDNTDQWHAALDRAATVLAGSPYVIAEPDDPPPSAATAVQIGLATAGVSFASDPDRGYQVVRWLAARTTPTVAAP